MSNDRIRARVKAAGKNLRTIIKERNEARAMYAMLLANIKKNYGAKLMIALRNITEDRAKEYAAKREKEMPI